MLDYGIALKCNDGALASLATRMLVRVRQVLIVIKRDKDSGNYIKAIITQLLVLLHQESAGLPQHGFME